MARGKHKYHKHKKKKHNNVHKRGKKKFRLPIVSIFFKSLFIALASFLLAFYMPNNITLLVEAAAWIYFSFVLFRGRFLWANNIYAGNDLNFWGLGLIGFLSAFFGVIITIIFTIRAIFIDGSAIMNIPILTLSIGLIILGAFISFRTERRHQTVGVWRA